MTVIDPDLVEKVKITGVSTDPDGLLSNRTTIATDDIADASQTAGLIQIRNTSSLEGCKATWNLGHGALKNGDTISIFMHSIGRFPPELGDKFVCMPYITANTVSASSSTWIEVVSPANNAFNVFTMDGTFRTALVDLDGNGKFSVRIIIDGAPNSLRRFARWAELDSDLTQPGGGVVQGGTSDIEATAIVDAFGRFIKGGAPSIEGEAVVTASGIRRRLGGVPNPVGEAVVSAQGGVIFDGGTTDPVGEAVVTATGFLKKGGKPDMVGEAIVSAAGDVVGETVGSSDIQGEAVVTAAGGVIFKNSVVSMEGESVVTSDGGVKVDGGTTSPVGEAVVTAAGGVILKNSVVSIQTEAVVTAEGGATDEPTIDGDTIRLLDFQFESVSLISDGTNWWIISLLLSLISFVPLANAAGTLSLPSEPVAVVAMSSLGAMSFDQSNSFFESPTSTVDSHPQRSFLDPGKLCPLNQSLSLFANCQPVVVSSVSSVDLHGYPSTVPRSVMIVIVSPVKAFVLWCETHVFNKIFVRLEKHFDPTTPIARPSWVFGVSAPPPGTPPRHICFDVHTEMVVGMSE